MESRPHKVKLYYIAGELYDWVTDPRALEKIFHTSRAKAAAKILNRVGKSSLAIDVGCGTGLITRSIRAKTVLGLDINRWNLERAKKRLPHADFVQCDSDQLPLRENLADLAVCTEILEHLYSPARTLSEIARVMKEDAKLVGSVPSQNPVWRLRNLLSVTHPKSEPFHNNFTRGQFTALLSTAFSKKKVFYDNYFMTIFFIAENPIRGPHPSSRQ